MMLIVVRMLRTSSAVRGVKAVTKVNRTGNHEPELARPEPGT